MNHEFSRSILIYMDQSEDSELARHTLARSGYQVQLCQHEEQVRDGLTQGAGALVLALAIVTPKLKGILRDFLNEQPDWAHLPILVLGSEEALAQGANGFLDAFETLANVNLMALAGRMEVLVSAVRSMLIPRQRQYEMRDLMQQLEASREEAIEANRAKSDFLANISHEIRTPLGAILGFSELLVDGGVSEIEKQVYMTTVKRNGQLLSALIDDILDLSKVEAGRIEIEKIEFSFNEMLSEIVSTIEPTSSKKGLPLHVQSLPAGTDSILSDPIRLKQILLNIVGNAVKFTSHGSVQVNVKLEAGDPAQLLIEVEDTGLGISTQQAARLFKPFTQADTSVTRRFSGTGLGLALSQKLARAMGGDLQLIWSIPGGGSAFRIHLPVQMVRQMKVKEIKVLRPAETSATLPLRGISILVVDDSLDNQMLISQILKLLGARVDLASDGQEGVDKALAQSYDVVLMDLQMPRLGGVEATRLLRHRGYDRPIVALTAHALKEDRQRCLSVGCTDYLTKPIQRSHLVQVLERISRVAPQSHPHH